MRGKNAPELFGLIGWSQTIGVLYMTSRTTVTVKALEERSISGKGELAITKTEAHSPVISIPNWLKIFCA